MSQFDQNKKSAEGMGQAVTEKTAQAAQESYSATAHGLREFNVTRTYFWRTSSRTKSIGSAIEYPEFKIIHKLSRHSQREPALGHYWISARSVALLSLARQGLGGQEQKDRRFS
jgi:hypothetical protein